MDFYIVNAFTSTSFGGNTAGIIIYEELNENIMQQLATELRFSETAFVKRISNEVFNIKYFTPVSEIELCGHATIASFMVLLQEKIIEKNNVYHIQTLSGSLNVYVDSDLIFMEAGCPQEGLVLDANLTNYLCSILSIDSSYVGDCNFKLKPQIISTGLYDIVLPVLNTTVLNNLKPDFKKLSIFSEQMNVVGVHAFTLGSKDFTASCRNFAPLYGIDEESATGTSNASLTYYLYKNRVLADLSKEFIFKQGESMNRPSDIITRFLDNERNKILVGGTAKIISKSKLFI
jgi:PhzF family phenazine biosynthesis protein